MSEKPKNPDVKENLTSQPQENNIDTIIENCINKTMERLQENNKNTDVITEMRVDKELNRLREQADKELNQLREQCKTEIKILKSVRENRWMVISFVVGSLGLFGSIGVPELILKPYVRNHIENRLVEKELKKTLDDIINPKIETIDKQLNEALKVSGELSNFMLTYFKAQSDDSEAYEQLATWGYLEDYKSYPFRAISANIYDSIRRGYIERAIPARSLIQWPEGVYPANFSYTIFKDYFKKLPPKFHADLVCLIWENKGLSKKEKMELLVDVIGTNSNSLNAKYFAGNYLADEMKIYWQPFDYTPIIKRWEETKDKRNEDVRP